MSLFASLKTYSLLTRSVSSSHEGQGQNDMGC